jgi:hypothetical protein
LRTGVDSMIASSGGCLVGATLRDTIMIALLR